MRVEAGGVIVEKARHIGGRQRRRRAPLQPGEARAGAVEIGGVGLQRAGVGRRGAPEPGGLAGLRQREPGRRPIGAEFERLLVHLRRRRPVAVFRAGLPIGEAPFGEGVGDGQGEVLSLACKASSLA